MITLAHVEALRDAGGTIDQVIALMEADARLRLERRLYRAVKRALAPEASGQQVVGVTEAGDAVVTPVTSQGVTAVTGVTRRNPMSAGAARTRRWRERQQIRAIANAVPADVAVAPHPVTSVTTPNSVTPVTAAAGRTPLKGVQPLPNRRNPKRAAADARAAGQLEMRTFGQIAGGRSSGAAQIAEKPPASAESKARVQQLVAQVTGGLRRRRDSG